MKTKKIITGGIAAALLTATLGVAAPANAGGLLADVFVKPFNPDLAKKLDQAHKKMGRPLDNAFAKGLNSVAPGAGTAWKIQDEFKRLVR